MRRVFILVASLALALGQDYQAEDQGARAQQLAPNYVHPDYHHHHHNLYEDAKAEPYDFGFQSTDEFGTVMNRQEASDNSGAVRGSYGYTDPYGVFRHVDYVADEFGFRAQVKSNEPGMGSQSPANVEIYAEPPPAGVIIERPYHPHPHHHHPQGAQAQSSQVQPQRRNPAPANPARQNRPTAQASSRSPAQASPAGARPSIQAGPFPFVPTRHNPYPSAASVDYPQALTRYGGAAPYPARSSYGTQSSSSTASSAAASSTTSQVSTTASNANAGVRYPVGNPHVTNFAPEGEKAEGGSILLPTVVASGVPTLVKHIHTYPVATV